MTVLHVGDGLRRPTDLQTKLLQRERLSLSGCLHGCTKLRRGAFLLLSLALTCHVLWIQYLESIHHASNFFWNFMETPGARLKAARTKRGLTLQALAEQTGYSASSINNVENGHDQPGRRLVLAAVAALGINENWLLTGTGEMFEGAEAKAALQQRREARSRAISRIQSAIRESGPTITLNDPEDRSARLLTFHEATKNDFGLLQSMLDAASRHFSDQRGIIQLPPGRRLKPLFGRIPAGPPREAIQEASEFVMVPDELAQTCDYALRVDGDSMTGRELQPGDIVLMALPERREPRVGDVVAALVDETEVTLKTYAGAENGHVKLRAENPRHNPEIIPRTQLQVQGVMVGKLA